MRGGLIFPRGTYHDRSWSTCGSFRKRGILADQDDTLPTGGLRPPLLVACTDAVADGRFSPTRMIPVARNTGSSPGSEAGFVRFSPMRALLCHGGLTPPAPGAVTTTVCRKNNGFLRCTNAHPQDGADGLYVSPSFVSPLFSSVERPSDGTHRACDVPWPLNRPD